MNKLYLYHFETEKNFSKEYFKNILTSYSSLTHLHFTKEANSMEFEHFIQDNLEFFFNLVENIENVSLIFNNQIVDRIKLIRIKNKKFILKIDCEFPLEIIKPYFNKIEEINYEHYSNYDKGLNLTIEESSLVSSITKIRIKSTADTLYIPVKSYKSLNVLVIHFERNYLENEFPLFSNNSPIQFPNLKYLEIKSKYYIDIFNALINNFINIPNIQTLSLRCEFNNNIKSYKKIISKCSSLKKLFTLILDSGFYKIELENVNKYYNIYPELKNTNIKLCFIKNY